MLTLIAYCNPDYKPGDGGALRLHDASSFSASSSEGAINPDACVGAGPGMGAASSRSWVHVEPRAGTIVAFDSMLSHEVLPAWAERFAVTLWLWRATGDEDLSSHS